MGSDFLSTVVVGALALVAVIGCLTLVANVVGGVKKRSDAKNVSTAKQVLRDDELDTIRRKMPQYLAINSELNARMHAEINQFENLQVTLVSQAMNQQITRSEAVHHIGAVTGWQEHQMYLTQNLNAWIAQKQS